MVQRNQKKENRGGKREGSGRKAVFELGNQERSDIIKKVKEQAKKNGTNFGSELGKLMFAPNAEKRLKMQAMQLFVRDVLPKTSERDVNVTEITKPQIFVPEKYPDDDSAPDFKTAPPPDFKTH